MLTAGQGEALLLVAWHSNSEAEGFTEVRSPGAWRNLNRLCKGE